MFEVRRKGGGFSHRHGRGRILFSQKSREPQDRPEPVRSCRITSRAPVIRRACRAPAPASAASSFANRTCRCMVHCSAREMSFGEAQEFAMLGRPACARAKASRRCNVGPNALRTLRPGSARSSFDRRASLKRMNSSGGSQRDDGPAQVAPVPGWLAWPCKAACCSLPRGSARTNLRMLAGHLGLREGA